MGCAFTPDASEFWYMAFVHREDTEWPTLFVSRRGPDGWSIPEASPFDTAAREFSPHISPDGRFFVYRQKPSDPDFQEGTWVSMREGNDWGEPSFFHEAYGVALDQDGTVYFTAEYGEDSEPDIAYMRLLEGVFTDSEGLPGEANSEFYEAHPAVAADGDFVLFDSERPDSLGGTGIHVSFRRSDGTYSPAQYLGDELGTDGAASVPCLVPGGGFLLFQAHGDLWWVSSDVIERWRSVGG
jgi:hypothetical protein